MGPSGIRTGGAAVMQDNKYLCYHCGSITHPLNSKSEYCPICNLVVVGDDDQ